jgi:hypothetical protein
VNAVRTNVRLASGPVNEARRMRFSDNGPR